MKIKILAILGVLALVFLALPARAAQDAPGTNVISGNTVYFIDASNQLRPYTSAGAFLSYGFNSFGAAVPASQEDLQLKTSTFVPPQDGSLINDNGTVYIITKGHRAGFASATVFTGFGYSFANALPGDTSFLNTLPPITSSAQAHPADTLVNLNGTIYLITSMGRVAIPSMDVFNSWGYALKNVVQGNQYDSALPQYSVVLGDRLVGQLSAYAQIVASGNTAPSTPTAPAAPAAADAIPPKIYIASPGNNQTVAGAVLITAVASDNVGVAKVQFSVDGQPYGDPVTTAPYTVSVDTTKFYGLTHTIGAAAYDAAGNTAFDQVALKFDNVSVDLNVTISPTITTLAAGKQQQFTATVNNSTNTGVIWEVNGSTGGDQFAGYIDQTGLFTAPFSVTSSGPVYATITAISQADTSKQASMIVQLTAN